MKPAVDIRCLDMRSRSAYEIDMGSRSAYEIDMGSRSAYEIELCSRYARDALCSRYDCSHAPMIGMPGERDSRARQSYPPRNLHNADDSPSSLSLIHI